MNKLVVYDILGKQMYFENHVNSNELLIANLVSINQVLLIQITLQNVKISNKKIFHLVLS